MEKYAIIGLGAFGEAVARALAESRKQVLAIDVAQEKVRQVADHVAHAMVLDASDTKALQEIGIQEIHAAVVGVGTLEASIMITLNLKELGVPYVVAKASSRHHGIILERIGADRVIHPERDMGRRLAQSLAKPTIFDHIQLSKEYSLDEILPPATFLGKSLRTLDLRARFGVNVVGLRRGKRPRLGLGHREINIAPQADAVIQEKDTLLVIGSNRNIEAFSKELDKLRAKRG